MASRKIEEYVPPEDREGNWHDHELEEGMHHLRKAHKIVHNKKFLAAVKAHAHKKEQEHRETMHHIDMLAKGGRISPRQREKISG